MVPENVHIHKTNKQTHHHDVNMTGYKSCEQTNGCYSGIELTRIHRINRCRPKPQSDNKKGNNYQADNDRIHDNALGNVVRLHPVVEQGQVQIAHNVGVNSNGVSRCLQKTNCLDYGILQELGVRKVEEQ